jgi:hypothetical protein
MWRILGGRDLSNHEPTIQITEAPKTKPTWAEDARYLVLGGLCIGLSLPKLVSCAMVALQNQASVQWPGVLPLAGIALGATYLVFGYRGFQKRENGQ